MTDLSAWPALVLAAGVGTRLRPLSLVRAKAALPVAGSPIIGRILRWLRAAGVRRVVINLHHRPESITRLVGDGSAWGVEVRYSWERDLLGSAGGPRRAIPLLDSDRFLIVNGDTLTDCDLDALTRRHLTTNARVTLAVVPGDVARYGGVIITPDDFVTGFARAQRSSASPLTPPTAPTAPDAPGAPGAPVLHFIGAQAVDADVFRDVSDTEPSETVRTLYPRLIADDPRSVAACRSDAEFLDIGTPRDYLETVGRIAARENQPFDRGEGCRVHSDAHVSGTVLWDRVTVGRGCRLVECVVADDVSVPDGANHERSVLITLADGRVDAQPL